MNDTMRILAAMLSAAPLLCAAPEITDFEQDWKFFRGEQAGAEAISQNETKWASVKLPHDWSIEGPFAETNPTGGAGAFMPSGIAWYRKHFTLPANPGSVAIQFDGVMQNSDVWINGFHLGHRPTGYVGFSYDLTSHLKPSGENVIAVRTDTSAQPASRWYSGAGIYRHVRLLVTHPVHIIENGVFVSTPDVSPQKATVKISTAITNQTQVTGKVIVRTTLLSADKKVAGMMETGVNLAASGNENVAQQLILASPQLWDLDAPHLYTVVSELRAGTGVVDTHTTLLGVRSARFEPETGFWLNGKNFKLKGVCLHADGGAFGAAVPLSIWEDRLKNLKTVGVNAIRTAHTPPSPDFLDLCDRMGFVVMDEMFDCWTVAKNPSDYHLFFKEWSKIDERDAILRDRNHACIILYSVGNEIHDTPHPESAKPILAGLVEVAHAADPTRPVTQALFRPNVSHDYDNGLADILDVVGQNYREQEIIAAHVQKPTRKIVGTENGHDRKAWLALRDNPPYAGQFLWTGIDYLGESRHWPIIGHGSGLLDRTGTIRPLARERQSWWSDVPMVAIARRLSNTDEMPADPGYGAEERHTQVLFSDWTPQNLQTHDEQVEIYSNAKEVELFLNGKSLGMKPLNADASARTWKVSFAPGTLKAVAKNDGRIVATEELQTAGKPAKIMLLTETKKLSADWNEVAIVRAKIVDDKGVEIPRASDLIDFKVSASGVIAAVDNGDNASHELFQAPSRHAFQGECVAFVKATGMTGDIILTASSPGLTAGSVTITSATRK